MQTPLWGFGKVIGLELPQVWGGLVDLPVGSEHQTFPINQLLAELAADKEELVALRSNRRYVCRLTKTDKATAKPMPHLQTEGSYLITGGLGSLGIKTAGWLVEQGANQ